MHVIPALIPEAILGTKEPSEKARGAAFDIILVMGRKMSSGGVVKRSMVDGMDEDAVDGMLCQFYDHIHGPDLSLSSQSKHRRIYDNGSGWPSWRKSTHDQCHHHSYFPPCV